MKGERKLALFIFSPLVSKLRENDRYVIGLGVKSSSSDLLVGTCDEFIFYEDLIRDSKKTTLLRGLPEKKAEAMAQLIDSVQALLRENKEITSLAEEGTRV